MKKLFFFAYVFIGLTTLIFSETLPVVTETPEQRTQRQVIEAIAALDGEWMQRPELEGLTELLILLENDHVDEGYLRALQMNLRRESQELFRQNEIKSGWMWPTALTGTLLVSIFGPIWFFDFFERDDGWYDLTMNTRTSGGLTLAGLGMIGTGLILEVRLRNGRFNLRKIEAQLNVLNNALRF